MDLFCAGVAGTQQCINCGNFCQIVDYDTGVGAMEEAKVEVYTAQRSLGTRDHGNLEEIKRKRGA